MSDPRMRVEALKWYMGVHPVNTSLIPDPPVRTLLLQRTRVKVALWRGRRWREWILACEERIRPGASIDWGGGSFIANPHFTSLLIVGDNVAERSGATRLGRVP